MKMAEPFCLRDRKEDGQKYPENVQCAYCQLCDQQRPYNQHSMSKISKLKNLSEVYLLTSPDFVTHHCRTFLVGIHSNMYQMLLKDTKWLPTSGTLLGNKVWVICLFRPHNELQKVDKVHT